MGVESNTTNAKLGGSSTSKGTTARDRYIAGLDKIGGPKNRAITSTVLGAPLVEGNQRPVSKTLG